MNRDILSKLQAFSIGLYLNKWTDASSQTITWDVENRPLTVTGGASFVYDGDGDRVKKTENSVTVLYVNKYYEKDLTNNVVTTYYYLGDRLVAKRAGTTLSYIHQDHLGGTSVVSDSNGASAGRIKYYPFGSTRSSTGTLPDQKFTGQRLDGTGLYFYNARYYDPTIGRFISADTIVPSFLNPQSLNRYSYVLNNPLRYVDPSGHDDWDLFFDVWNNPPAPPTPSSPPPVPTPPPQPPAGGSSPNLPASTASTSGMGPSPVPTPLGGGSPGGTQSNAGAAQGVQVTLSSGVIVISVPEGSAPAVIMNHVPTGSALGAGAITLNPFVIVRPQIYNPSDLPGVMAHENVHVWQQRIMGSSFYPVYGLFSLAFGYNNNPFEIMAKQISGH